MFIKNLPTAQKITISRTTNHLGSTTKTSFFATVLSPTIGPNKASAIIPVKKLSLTEDIYIIIKYFPLISVIALSPIVYFNWVTPNLNDLIWIIGIGIFTQAGQTFLTIGIKKLPTSQAATINYLQVLFGSLWGILFFNEIININFIVGSLLVLLGTIMSTSKILKTDLK